MKVLAISGSASLLSSNFYLLQAISKLWKEKAKVSVAEGLADFKMFSPQALEAGVPEEIQYVKNQITNADLVIIATSEYSHNIPACLKNLLEWCTASGEFHQKKVIPITFTPNEPRGKFAMQSLLMSLKSMKAQLLTQIPLYKTDVEIQHQKIILPEEIQIILDEALHLAG